MAAAPLGTLLPLFASSQDAREFMMSNQQGVVAPQFDPVAAFNLMLKMLKRVCFTQQVNHSSTAQWCTCDVASGGLAVVANHDDGGADGGGGGRGDAEEEAAAAVCVTTYERTACLLDRMLVQWFQHPTPVVDPLRGLQMGGCLFLHNVVAATAPVAGLHTNCGRPRFPSSIVARVTECNHTLQAHLVSGDPCVAAMANVLRTAMAFSQDFAVVVALVVQDFVVRKRRQRTQGQLPLVGYAHEPVVVRFINFVAPPASAWRPVAWCVVFPARKLLAAFWSNKRLWQGLCHTPCFTAIEVGQKVAAEQWRQPQAHSLSPQLLTVWPLSVGPAATPFAELLTAPPTGRRPWHSEDDTHSLAGSTPLSPPP